MAAPAAAVAGGGAGRQVVAGQAVHPGVGKVLGDSRQFAHGRIDAALERLVGGLGQFREDVPGREVLSPVGAEGGGAGGRPAAMSSSAPYSETKASTSFDSNASSTTGAAVRRWRTNSFRTSFPRETARTLTFPPSGVAYRPAN